MCYSRNCPAEDHRGDCTHSQFLGPFPCEVREVFDEAPAPSLTHWLCPRCFKAGQDVLLYRGEDGLYLCRTCGEAYDDEDLALAMRELVSGFIDEAEAAKEALHRAEASREALADTLAGVRNAALVAA